MINSNKHKNKKIDCFTIADDIYEKLKLIGYESNFCTPTGFKDFHKYYFTTKLSNSNIQFTRFSETMLWIIFLISNVSNFK
jgi:estrogen-related receptor beta like 1